jgi:hypothetical protein
MRLFIAIGVVALAIGLGLAYQFFVADGTAPMVMTDDDSQDGRLSIEPTPGGSTTGGDAGQAGTGSADGQSTSDQVAQAPLPQTGGVQTPSSQPATGVQPEETDGPLRLSLPVDCELGGTCLLFTYPDAGLPEAPADHACGPLTRAAETSTEIRLIDHIEMESGVAALAAAPGTVVAVRDDLPDVSYRLLGVSAVIDDARGNFVQVEHRDGYVTTYSHLRRGSTVVAVGDTVSRGQALARVGMSGLTEHPVIGFEVSRNGAMLDPFTGLPLNSGCDVAAVEPLWRDDLAEAMNYRRTSLLRLGFADRVLNRAAVEYSLFSMSVPATSDALVLHVYIVGVRAGDAFVAEITDPTGARFVKSGRTFDQSAQVELLAIGRQDLDTPLIPGEYAARFRYFSPDPETGEQAMTLSFPATVTVR